MWGETIKELDLLRSLVVEWGCTASEQRQGAYARRTTAFALNRLFSRAFEIVGEILVLIRSGYADGALARWRSLHEICVIAMFLGKKSDRCAEMYLAHHCIEEFRLLQVDKSSGTAKSMSTHRDRYLRDLKTRRDALVAKYGTPYANDNGWAAVELGRARVTFKDLETQVGLDILRRGYQRANSTVHGGALATLTRVSLNAPLVDDTHIPPAHGCQTAAEYAASSLSMLVAELCIDTQSPDLVAMSMVIVNRASQSAARSRLLRQRSPVTRHAHACWSAGRPNADLAASHTSGLDADRSHLTVMAMRRDHASALLSCTDDLACVASPRVGLTCANTGDRTDLERRRLGFRCTRSSTTALTNELWRLVAYILHNAHCQQRVCRS